MKRRDLIVLLGTASFGVQGQVQDINDAINKAGRQRMLSQRMSKAWLALVQKTESGAAQQVLERSMALFDRQLAELKAYAPNAEIRKTYQDMEGAWSDFKAVLVGSHPSRDGAGGLLNTDARVLALAHQGTVQFEAVNNKPVGRLVNVAGRQRMLSQRMAKYFYAATLRLEPQQAQAEIGKARGEFLTALEVLRNAPEATSAIKQELALADNQWFFFDLALKEINNAGPKSMSDMFVSSENLLTVMDRITGLYAGLKA